MPGIRGVTVSVGYATLLSITLVRNMRHMMSCLIITSPDDRDTQTVARSVPGVRVFETNDFYSYGARFNKGLCIERGFDVLGREGWIAVVDADVLLPDVLPLDQLKPGRLYGAKRRILEDPARWSPDLDWNTCPRSLDGGPVGFLQIFHAADPYLKDKSPWYDVSFGHAGGCDAFFMTHWPRDRWTVLPMDVLHLGPVDRNWFGTSPEAHDIMAKFVHENGWRRAAQRFTPEQAMRAGEIVHRVQVPGYPISTYELPFVRRSKARNGDRPA